MPSHRITLYYITLHYKPLHNITLPYKALHTIAYHTFTWYYIALHCIIITYVKHRHTSVLFTEIQARKESLDAWRWIKTKHSRAWRCFAIDCLAPRPITKRAKDWTHKAAVSPPSSPEIMKCVPTSSNRCAKIFRCADAPRFSISKTLCNWLFCHFSWAASAAETCHKKKQSQKKISAIATTYFWARCMLRGVGPFWCEIRTVRCWRVWLVTSVAKCHPEIFHVQPSFRFNRWRNEPHSLLEEPNVRLLVEKKLLRETLDLYLAHIQHLPLDSPNLSRVGKSMEQGREKICSFLEKRKDQKKLPVWSSQSIGWASWSSRRLSPRATSSANDLKFSHPQAGKGTRNGPEAGRGWLAVGTTAPCCMCHLTLFQKSCIVLQKQNMEPLVTDPWLWWKKSFM